MTESARLEDKLRRLIELRKKEEQEYGKLLTKLDETWKFPLPHETSARLSEVKDALNQIWDISKDAFSATDSEDRTFWKEVAGSVHEYMNPVVHQQREVNSAVVHLLNEYIVGVHQSMEHILEFQRTLILYFQRIVPVIDTKFREATGTAEAFQTGLRDYMDLMYQRLDKKIETLRVDVDELKKLVAHK
jgi:hypothetical protein